MNPYAVSLDPAQWEAEGLLGNGGLSVREAAALIPEMERVWLDEIGVPVAG